jgi:hypothetical protein
MFRFVCVLRTGVVDLESSVEMGLGCAALGWTSKYVQGARDAGNARNAIERCQEKPRSQTKERMRMHRSSDRQGDCTAGPSSAAVNGEPGDDGRFALPSALHNGPQRAATGVAASGACKATVAALLILAAGHAVRVDGCSWQCKM